jgi:hypothetical protein
MTLDVIERNSLANVSIEKQDLRDLCPVHLFVISSTAELSSRIQNRELR